MMITRCPECATAFRISREQLEARAGRVRCGRCREVFDALSALETLAPERAAETEPDSAGPPGTDVRDELALQEVEAIAPASSEQPADAAQTRREPVLADPAETATVANSAGALGAAPAETAMEASPADTLGAAPNWVQTPAVTGSAAGALDEPAFRRDHSYQFEFGKKRRSRRAIAGWSVTALVLVLALAAQALFHFRGSLALVPALKTHVYTICAGLGCEVPLPRRVDMVSIETYEVRAEQSRPGVMLLSATLRNLAPFPQEYPALELTLTDERDQPLARRVLQAREYLGREPDEFAAASEQEVRLHFEVATLKPSKYRLLLFYP
jgi:predicted Zn finger-like uncharacterized protein